MSRIASLRTITFIFLICAITLFGILLYSFQKEYIKRHTVLYDGALFTPEFVVIHLGDPVIIKNSSQKPMEIAVGRHENHKTLSGFQEKIINPKEEYAFTPQERGIFDLHDHFNPKKFGYIIIDK
ncbi:MAG: hypothetical protein G01um10145_750 [Microgenomates group bacterium Gr01-1014_5]|nr:MAG: hypothetical protein G01um10145_750 [Microgenomates group bacterium Gr01-1014_5]